MAGVPACQIELEFADGTYLFRLNLPQIAELETKCGIEGKPSGIGAIFARVLKGRYVLTDGTTLGNPEEAEYRVHDITETIRLGLIGGGQGVVNERPVKVDPITARRLVENYVVNRPLKEGWSIAAAILGACCEGYEDPEAPPPKKDEPTKAKAASTTPAP